MSKFKMSLGDAHEDELVPEGEYELEITDATDGRNKADTRDQVQVVITITNPPRGVEFPAPIYHYISSVNDNDDEKKARFMILNTKRFLTMFGIDFTDEGFESDDLLGAKAKGFVFVEEDENTHEERHVLKVPRLGRADKDEGDDRGASRRGRRRAEPEPKAAKADEPEDDEEDDDEEEEEQPRRRRRR